ncbi:unnamed protein product [Soboliphyme baturini]|uniref:Glutathione peroxidase n=1 Tax=Soboliphyme baturini TaxID=241478 RepID=A0A183IXI4_9BILA|nr:unnamed protein product [Soboliphyme baturini]
MAVSMEKYEIAAFPCNQFGEQEPKTEAEIKQFVAQYNVTFDMYAKVKVNGEGAHPLFCYLKNNVEGTLSEHQKPGSILITPFHHTVSPP